MNRSNHQHFLIHQAITTNLSNNDKVVVQKQMEKEHSERIEDQIRNMRSHFYRYQIKCKLDSAKVEQKYHSQIITLLAQAKQYKGKFSIVLQKLGELSQYHKQILQLKQLCQSMQKRFALYLRECLPMTQIAKLKLTTLRYIHIQYLKNYFKQNELRYSISAFEFFKVVSQNKLLEQVYLKGVKVQHFQQIIELINPFNINQVLIQKRKEHSWIQYFNHFNSIKLSIDAQNETIMSKINDLNFFVGQFISISDIIVKVYFDKFCDDVDFFSNTLDLIWGSAITIKKLKIQIDGQGIWDQVSFQLVSAARSALFGRISSFTEIDQLVFKNFSFNSQISANDFLSIEQSLKNLFQNNVITNLRISSCYNFPIFPAITTLQSIISQTSFRKHFNFMEELVLTNPLLKRIKTDQGWKISEKLFNQSQILFIQHCKDATLGDMSSQQPSNIKQLKIQSSSIGNVASLSAILHKLANLTYLNLSYVVCGGQHISMIPSPNLNELRIQVNEGITDQGLQLIDLRWPKLRRITLRKCSHITQNVWKNCKFKGLIRLKVELKLFKKEGNFLSQLLKKGVDVDFF